MMTITEKVAYLKGLVEGMNLDADTNETKLFKAMLDVLDDMALTVDDLEDSVDTLADQVESMDEDLDVIADDLYGDEDEDDDECDCDEDPLYEVTCPKCGDSIYVDEDGIAQGSIECPNCGEKLEFECDCDEDSCGCGDDCGCDKE